MIKICAYCDKEFQAKHGIRDKFCSVQCSSKGQRLKRQRWESIEIAYLKTNTTIPISEIAQRLNRTRSAILGQRHKLNITSNQPAQSIICLECGREFKVPIYRLNRLAKYPQPFCGRQCRFRWAKKSGILTKENSSNWKGGCDYGLHWDTIRKRIPRKRCTDCGATTRLELHHLIPPRQFLNPDFAHFSKNLTCLCRTCHLKRHSNKVKMGV